MDPDGYAFLSNGACYGNRMGIYSLISGVEQLAAALLDAGKWRPSDIHITSLLDIHTKSHYNAT